VDISITSATKERFLWGWLGLVPGFAQISLVAMSVGALSAVGVRPITWISVISASGAYAATKIEELIFALKKHYTIIIVTHNMQQAARVSDLTAFFLLGKLVEMNTTEKMFTAPDDRVTEDYITGRFG